MKKLLMMVAVAMMMTMSVKAQSAGEWSFKGRIGSNMSTVTNNDDAKWKFGLSAALGVDYMFTDKFGASLELNRNVFGSKSKFLDEDSKIDYFHIPLLAKYYAAPWFALQAGPQIGFLNSAKRDGVSYKDTCKKTEFSIPLGVSFEPNLKSFSSTSSVIIDLRYHLGLTKVNDYGLDSYCNRAFILSIGYKFGL